MDQYSDQNHPKEAKANHTQEYQPIRMAPRTGSGGTSQARRTVYWMRMLGLEKGWMKMEASGKADTLNNVQTKIPLHQNHDKRQCDKNKHISLCSEKKIM